MKHQRKVTVMRNKIKTNETTIRREVREDDGAQYTYTLVMHESRATASFGIPLYSVRIEMTDAEGNKSDSEVGDVFADAGRAIVFYEKLVRNLATPIDLAYVLEDDIG